MKTLVYTMVSLALSLTLCACSLFTGVNSKDVSGQTGEPTPSQAAAGASATDSAPQEQDTAPKASPNEPTPMLTAASVPEPSANAEPSGLPTASNAPEMYSSYAHLVDFDPASGTAKFDFFDLLRGNEAIEWLMQNKGYTKAKAEAEVAEWADSEYIEKNENTQLRGIDIDNVSLSLMYQPSGAQVEGAEPVPSSADDFRKIYAINPTLLKTDYFYYIHVKNGNVSLVEQVYWP